jgi:hypothetical protein
MFIDGHPDVLQKRRALPACDRVLAAKAPDPPQERTACHGVWAGVEAGDTASVSQAFQQGRIMHTQEATMKGNEPTDSEPSTIPSSCFSAASTETFNVHPRLVAIRVSALSHH